MGSEGLRRVRQVSWGACHTFLYGTYLPTCTYLSVPACLPTDSNPKACNTNLDRQLAEESRLSLPISTFMQAV